MWRLELNKPDFPIWPILSIAAQSYSQHSCRVHEIECLIIGHNGKQIVSPRGTEADALISGHGWIDIISDLRVFPWYDKRVGWSHAGFLKGAKGLVEHALIGMLDRDLPIILTGHSLGGAIAINAALLLHAEGFDISAVVTFGAPRTLLRSSKDRFGKAAIPVYEYSNPGDPVPNVPMRWFGYRHINEIHTNRPADGYSLSYNHGVGFYKDAFRGLD